MKVYIFSVSSKNLIYRIGRRSMICAITNSLEANPGQIFTTHKSNVTLGSLQCNSENGLYIEVGNTSSPTIKRLKVKNYLHSYIVSFCITSHFKDLNEVFVPLSFQNIHIRDILICLIRVEGTEEKRMSDEGDFCFALVSPVIRPKRCTTTNPKDCSWWPTSL